MDGEKGGTGGRSSARSQWPVRGPVWPPLGGSRRTVALLRPLPLPRPRRAAAARGLSLFPVRLFRSVSGGWCASVPPVGGKGGRPAPASRRPLAAAPGRVCRTEPASSCEGVRAGVSAWWRSSLPRLPPRPLSGYLATASRRVGLKTPGGSPFRPRGRGGGGARGEKPSAFGGSPRTPVPRAAGGRSRGAPRSGFGSPPWAPVGLSSACPVRRCVVGRGPRACRCFPFLSPGPLFLFSASPSCLAGRPEANPSPLSVGEGTVPPSAPLRKEETNVRTTLSGGSLGSCVDEERS